MSNEELSYKDAVRFARHANRARRTPAGCWEWPLSDNGNGYGAFRANIPRRRLYAHRVSYVLMYGPVDAGLYVLHKCDNPSCVNPEHLFIGTPKDNHIDMTTKGRGSPPPVLIGSAHGRARATEQVVIEIRRLRCLGATIGSLAAKYDLGKSTVGHIVACRTWRHI